MKKALTRGARHFFSILATLSAVFVSSTALAQTTFYYRSTPGDWVGAGNTRTFTAPANAITVTGGTSSLNVSVRERSDFSGEWWDARFSAPAGQTFAVGPYEGAQRFGSATSAGLDMGGTGRGCNQTLSRIWEIRFRASR
jgi:hypothetical protein